jgi:hypothetical protein
MPSGNVAPAEAGVSVLPGKTPAMTSRAAGSRADGCSEFERGAQAEHCRVAQGAAGLRPQRIGCSAARQDDVLKIGLRGPAIADLVSHRRRNQSGLRGRGFPPRVQKRRCPYRLTPSLSGPVVRRWPRCRYRRATSRAAWRRAGWRRRRRLRRSANHHSGRSSATHQA